MSTKKNAKSYVDYGLGFPVQIYNAPLSKIRGKWVLDIDFEKYERTVLFALTSKPSRLSGNEIKFIRHYLEMDLKAFGKRFGDVSHPAVIKWERCGDEATNMSWAIEKDIRLAIVDKIKPRMLRKIYEELQHTFPNKSQKIKIDTSDLDVA